MSINIEALKLAELLEKNTWPTLEEQHKAVSELRRLVAENEALQKENTKLFGWWVEAEAHGIGEQT